MKSAQSLSATRDSVLARLMDEYLASCELGQPLTTDDLAGRYPELADDVSACLASLEFIRRAAAGSAGRGGVAPAVVSGPDGMVGEGPAARGQLGDYRIAREVGRGGMGVVYEAEQISLARRVALKVLPFAAVLDDKQLQRFKNEALAAAQLDHPHIVDVLAVGVDRGTHFYAMRFIDGCSLAEVIAERVEHKSQSEKGAQDKTGKQRLNATGLPANGLRHADTTPLTPSSTLPIGHRTYFRSIAALIADAADALHHAHEQGIIHRDIKPSNLMLDNRGKLWVTDFGLAHIESGQALTMTGDFLGTLRYMSPEQALGSRLGVDHRTDVYALGATLYELLTLHPIFGSVERPRLLQRIAAEDPTPPRRLEKSIPVELEIITLKAIQKSPAYRYSTAQALAEDLRRYLEHKPIRARRPGPVEVAKKWVGRHVAFVSLVTAASLVLALLLCIGAAVLWREQGLTKAALAASQRNAVLADERRRQAEEASDQVRLRLYAADIRLAFQAWNHGDLAQTTALLDRCQPAAGQPDLRGFEWHFLWRLCHDNKLTLAGHTGDVFSVAFSPDGQRLVTAGQDGTARIWDAETGQELLTLRGHTADVRAACFAPHGDFLATASDDRTIRLWDATTGEHRHSLAEHTRELRCLAISPDGYWLASGGLDDTAMLWDLTTRQLSAVFYGHLRGVRGIAFSPDSQTLATGAGDHYIKLWDVETRMQRAMLVGNVTWVASVAFSPDGKSLASGAWGPVIKLWDVQNGSELREFSEHTNWVESVAFSPDFASLLSASRDGTVRIWNLASGTSARVLRADPAGVHAAAWSPDGQTIATAGVGGLVKLWRRDAQARYRELAIDWPTKRDHPGGASMLTSLGSPGGTHLAYFTSHDRELRVLDLVSGQMKTTCFGDADELAFRSLAISPDGKLVATGTRDGLVQLWDYPTGTLRRDLGRHTAMIHNLAFSPDGRWLASGDAVHFAGHHGGACLWNVATGEQHWSAAYKDGSVRDFDFSPDGQWLAANDGHVRSVADGSSRFVLAGPIGPVGAIRFSPDGRHLATGDDDGNVRLWDATTGQLRATLLGHVRNVGSLAFSPDSRTLVTAGHDRTIRLWNVATGQEIAAFEGHHDEGCVLAFCQNGQALASLGNQKMFLWSTQSTPLPIDH